MKNNKYEIDMCNGTLMDKLISFSLPLMLSGILQLLFNAVDIIVVGRFTGSQALAAVGSTTALINIYQSVYWDLSGCERSGSTFLCFWQRERNVRDSTYIYYPGTDQWTCYGTGRSIACKIRTESYGNSE